MNDEPRIVQGQIGPIHASDLMRQMMGGQDPRDADLDAALAERDKTIAELRHMLAESNDIVDQYHNFLVEMQDAASSLSETLSLVLQRLGDRG